MTDPHSPQPTPHTAAQRIKDLNEIDKLATTSLNSAGLALRALTIPQNHNTGPTSSDNANTNTWGDSAKADFETHTRDFFNAVQSLGARLRRQAYALEEAGIISKEKETGGSSETHVTNGGLGGLDVGWLNSRRDDVGRRKEEELWAEARKLVESLESTKGEEKNQEDSMDTAE